MMTFRVFLKSGAHFDVKSSSLTTSADQGKRGKGARFTGIEWDKDEPPYIHEVILSEIAAIVRVE